MKENSNECFQYSVTRPWIVAILSMIADIGFSALWIWEGFKWHVYGPYPNELVIRSLAMISAIIMTASFSRILFLEWKNWKLRKAHGHANKS